MVKARPLVDILVILFGISSWVCLNGIWVELPILVPQLPELWNLPSYIALIVQIANIGPLTYMIIHRFFSNSDHVEKWGVFAILAVGCAASFVLIFTWDNTAKVGGVDHSVSFFILIFIMAILECTSSVAFPAYIGNMESVFLPSLLVGESLSGLLPAILALVQGTGGEGGCRNTTTSDITGLNIYIRSEMKIPKPAITVEIFLAVITGMEIVSLLAFLGLHFMPDRIKHDVTYPSSSEISVSEDGAKDPTPSQVTARISQIANDVMLGTDSDISCEFSWWKKVIPLLLLQAWICFLMNGFMPSIQSYSCMPYGSMTYHLTVTLQAIAAVIASSVALFFGPGRKRWKYDKFKVVSPLVVIGTVCSIYIIITAALGPDPPLKENNGGRALVVISWVIQGATYSYTKTHLASMLRQLGKKPLLWWGVATQAGSLIGAVISFLIVIVFKVFTADDSCLRN